jgi:hypothetical protein
MLDFRKNAICKQDKCTSIIYRTPKKVVSRNSCIQRRNFATSFFKMKSNKKDKYLSTDDYQNIGFFSFIKKQQLNIAVSCLYIFPKMSHFLKMYCSCIVSVVKLHTSMRNSLNYMFLGANRYLVDKSLDYFPLSRN